MTEETDIDALLCAYQKARRAVIGHVIFLVICCAAALLLRRYFNLPLILCWTVFAVAGLVFSGDIIQLISCHLKLKRFIAKNTLN
ncbi:MAG: hypothetical protein RIQ93_2975 [Verrucomicrobiota bacterium]